MTPPCTRRGGAAAKLPTLELVNHVDHPHKLLPASCSGQAGPPATCSSCTACRLLRPRKPLDDCGHWRRRCTRPPRPWPRPHQPAPLRPRAPSTVRTRQTAKGCCLATSSTLTARESAPPKDPRSALSVLTACFAVRPLQGGAAGLGGHGGRAARAADRGVRAVL